MTRPFSCDYQHGDQPRQCRKKAGGRSFWRLPNTKMRKWRNKLCRSWEAPGSSDYWAEEVAKSDALAVAAKRITWLRNLLHGRLSNGEHTTPLRNTSRCLVSHSSGRAVRQAGSDFSAREAAPRGDSSSRRTRTLSTKVTSVSITHQ